MVFGDFYGRGRVLWRNLRSAPQVSVKVEGVGAFNICMLRADRAPTATFTILPLTGKAEFRVTGPAARPGT